MNIAKGGFEDFVERTVIVPVLRDPGVVVAMATSTDDETGAVVAELTEVEQRLTDLDEMWVEGTITRQRYTAMSEKLEVKRAALDAKLQRLRIAPPELPEGAVDLWPHMTPDERNEIARLLVKRIVVAPALARGLRRFDPRRVTVETTFGATVVGTDS